MAKYGLGAYWRKKCVAFQLSVYIYIYTYIVLIRIILHRQAADAIGVEGKTVLVIGTQQPWVEAVLLTK